MGANDIQDLAFGHWGRFHDMEDPEWQPNFNHEAQQLAPPPPLVPLSTADFLGRRVRKNFPGYGPYDGTVVAYHSVKCKFAVKFDDDNDKTREYTYKALKAMLVAV